MFQTVCMHCGSKCTLEKRCLQCGKWPGENQYDGKFRPEVKGSDRNLQCLDIAPDKRMTHRVQSCDYASDEYLAGILSQIPPRVRSLFKLVEVPPTTVHPIATVVCNLLEDIYKKEPRVLNLLEYRVRIGDGLNDHPTVQVGSSGRLGEPTEEMEEYNTLSVLGLLNGLCEEGWAVAKMWNDENSFAGFTVVKPTYATVE